VIGNKKKGVPLFGTTTIKEPIGKKITPLHETKDFVQNLRAQEFLKLVNEEDLPVTLFHIRAANAEKGTKSNSGGYEAQGKDNKREMTNAEVLQAKYHPNITIFKTYFRLKKLRNYHHIDLMTIKWKP
jgi:hypothetical protein